MNTMAVKKRINLKKFSQEHLIMLVKRFDNTLFNQFLNRYFYLVNNYHMFLIENGHRLDDDMYLKLFDKLSADEKDSFLFFENDLRECVKIRYERRIREIKSGKFTFF